MKAKLINTVEAAQRLGFTRDYVRLLCVNGRIKAQKVGQDWVMTESAIKNIRRKVKLKEGEDGSERSVDAHSES